MAKEWFTVTKGGQYGNVLEFDLVVNETAEKDEEAVALVLDRFFRAVLMYEVPHDYSFARLKVSLSEA